MPGKPYCIIPGCKSTWKKSNKTPYVKKGLFSLPKNQEDSEKWCKAIQRFDKALKKGDKVCELHFTEDDIIRYYETKLPDGTVWKLERARLNLKKGAVPTIFSNLQNIPSKRKSQNIPSKRKSQNAQSSTKTSQKNRKILPKKNLESPKSTFSEDPVDLVVTVNNPKNIEAVEDENSNQTEKMLYKAPETFTYNTLVNNLDLVSRPGLLWGITIQDEFVMCAKWSEDSVLMKRVIIHSNLKVQVFLKNKAIDFDNVKISNVNDLSSMLFEVDKYGICINANNLEKTECDGYILSKSGSNLCEYCQLIGSCAINRDKILYWLSKGRDYNKQHILYDRIRALSGRNAILKERLSKMIKIKAIWKLSK